MHVEILAVFGGIWLKHLSNVIFMLYNKCRADVNHDGFLERSELKSWIMAKVQEHLEEATAENAKIFHHLDTDSDGKMFTLCF